VFKIAKAQVAAPFVSGSLTLPADEHDLLAQFSVSEGWIGDLSNGVIKLGRLSTMLHGLPSSECGLLNLLRCYDSYDRARILELFEQAATVSSSFCFSTTVLAPGSHRQPLFCIGESVGTEEKYTGSMTGVFIFPRFKLEHSNLSEEASSTAFHG
jgi:hypothetical protein